LGFGAGEFALDFLINPLKIAGKFNVKDLFAASEDLSKLKVREARTLNS
jgi:hypothetical protein